MIELNPGDQIIVEATLEGRTQAQIAADLGLDVHTVARRLKVAEVAAALDERRGEQLRAISDRLCEMVPRSLVIADYIIQHSADERVRIRAINMVLGRAIDALAAVAEYGPKFDANTLRIEEVIATQLREAIEMAFTAAGIHGTQADEARAVLALKLDDLTTGKE